ncbi:CLUMA_CG015718, isoform A [Clunio marinus]|uniref:CLUMA_CG015718, isoform A n=1 Tax=Clunio marinus TaxID=568069 RepID=A0A1J1ITJ4_9DIPT|nr:CLUMA_CG015718, isoform A [Clunio marinus]
MQNNVDESVEKIVKADEKKIAEMNDGWSKVVSGKTKKTKAPNLREPVIIISPNDESQEMNKTEASLKCIEPSDFSVRGLSKGAKNSVIIRVENENDCDNLMKEATVKLGDKYNIRKPAKRFPRFKILEVFQPEDDNEKFIKKLINQNSHLKDDKFQFEVIKREQNKSKELEINGYNFISCDSDSSHTGGVIMYVRNDLCFNILKNFQKSRTWILSVKISESLINGIYTVIYKSPKEKIGDFLEIIDEFLEQTIDDDTRNVIVGDMNIDVSKNNKNVKRYLSMIQDHNLKQIVDEFTRIQVRRSKHEQHQISKTTIDHILTNSNDIEYAVNRSEAVTDHFMLQINLNDKKCVQKKKKIQEKVIKNCWKNYSRSSLHEAIENIDWNECNSQCYDKKFSAFVEDFKCSINKIVVKKNIYKSKNEWFNESIKKLKKEKQYLTMKHEFSGSENDRIALMKIIKKYKEEIKIQKCKVIQEKIKNNFSDNRKLWKILKSLYNEKKSEINSIELNGALMSDSSEIAATLNKIST